MPFVDGIFPDNASLYSIVGSDNWCDHSIETSEIFRNSDTWEKVLWDKDINYMRNELDKFLTGHNDLYIFQNGTMYSVSKVWVAQDGRIMPLFWAEAKIKDNRNT